MTDDSAVPAGLKGNRNYQLAWFGGAVSGLGDIVAATAVLLWVGAVLTRDLSWAPLAVSAVVLCEMVATVVFGPIGGVYADRWDRRRTMLVADLVRAGLMGGIILVPALGSGLGVGVQLALVCGLLLVSASVSQFFRPARFGLMGVVVADADRERVGSITQGTDALISIIGPPLAAPLLISTAHGIEWAIAINGLSYLASFAAILFVRVPPAPAGDAATPRTSARQDLRAGMRFVWGNRALRLIITAVVLVTFGAGAINVLDLFFVTRNLHVAASLYGLMDAAFGAGLVVGAVVFSVLGPKIGAVRVFSFSLVAIGVLLGLYSRSTTLWFALVALFVVAVPVAGVNAMVGPLLFRQVSRDMLGRVLGVLNPLQTIAGFASAVISTWLAATVLRGLDVRALGLHFGPIDTVFLAGGLVIAATGVWALTAMRTAFAPPAAAGGATPGPPELAEPEPA